MRGGKLKNARKRPVRWLKSSKKKKKGGKIRYRNISGKLGYHKRGKEKGNTNIAARLRNGINRGVAGPE